mmetsp:Transcript_24711/g.48617  ORF Transcript_24711/g.48617 Transcript_24711/m.48617 type:complete len:744 (-) Transcript_24711:106-2337(-)|eukprot:CAMPEP_0175145084 /NCGR_PEP_ID=MMETSP0087-20121206/14542_1 /TAXON_ID=136419 /ORGANISM="Unknown Unknown, Strain D1" /LENGTH=743 /DNA_ID=CAMNT_0016429727 /DNA_START=66 /DNA_END=2297 /DNA_ORIENTATION=-
MKILVVSVLVSGALAQCQRLDKAPAFCKAAKYYDVTDEVDRRTDRYADSDKQDYEEVLESIPGGNCPACQKSVKELTCAAYFAPCKDGKPMPKMCKSVCTKVQQLCQLQDYADPFIAKFVGQDPDGRDFKSRLRTISDLRELCDDEDMFTPDDSDTPCTTDYPARDCITTEPVTATEVPAGQKCSFPFQAYGVSYDQCTNQGYGGPTWCVTDPATAAWGYCDTEICDKVQSKGCRRCRPYQSPKNLCAEHIFYNVPWYFTDEMIDQAEEKVYQVWRNGQTFFNDYCPGCWYAVMRSMCLKLIPACVSSTNYLEDKTTSLYPLCRDSCQAQLSYCGSSLAATLSDSVCGDAPTREEQQGNCLLVDPIPVDACQPCFTKDPSTMGLSTCLPYWKNQAGEQYQSHYGLVKMSLGYYTTSYLELAVTTAATNLTEAENGDKRLEAVGRMLCSAAAYTCTEPNVNRYLRALLTDETRRGQFRRIAATELRKPCKSSCEAVMLKCWGTLSVWSSYLQTYYKPCDISNTLNGQYSQNVFSDNPETCFDPVGDVSEYCPLPGPDFIPAATEPPTPAPTTAAVAQGSTKTENPAAPDPTQGPTQGPTAEVTLPPTASTNAPTDQLRFVADGNSAGNTLCELEKFHIVSMKYQSKCLKGAEGATTLVECDIADTAQQFQVVDGVATSIGGFCVSTNKNGCKQKLLVDKQKNDIGSFAFNKAKKCLAVNSKSKVFLAKSCSKALNQGFFLAPLF